MSNQDAVGTPCLLCQQFQFHQLSLVNQDALVSISETQQQIQSLEMPYHMQIQRRYCDIPLEEWLKVIASVEKGSSVQFSDLLREDATRELFCKTVKRVFDMEDVACCTEGTVAFPYCRIARAGRTPYSGQSRQALCEQISLHDLVLVADCVRCFVS